MSDNDRSPGFIAQRYKRAKECVQLAPELVGQATAAAVLRRLRKVHDELKPAIDEMVQRCQALLVLPPSQRLGVPLEISTITSLCDSRDHKILGRALLAIRGTILKTVDALTDGQLRKFIASEWVKREVEASFVSPTKYRVEHNSLQADPNSDFLDVMDRAIVETLKVADGCLERWAETGRRDDIGTVKMPTIDKLGTKDALTSSRHEVEPDLGFSTDGGADGTSPGEKPSDDIGGNS